MRALAPVQSRRCFPALCREVATAALPIRARPARRVISASCTPMARACRRITSARTCGSTCQPRGANKVLPQIETTLQSVCPPRRSRHRPRTDAVHEPLATLWANWPAVEALAEALRRRGAQRDPSGDEHDPERDVAGCVSPLRPKGRAVRGVPPSSWPEGDPIMLWHARRGR